MDKVDASVVFGCEMQERALLASIWVNENIPLLAKVVEADFQHLENRFVFRQFSSMVKAGEPLADSVALTRWFRMSNVRAEYKRLVGDNPPLDVLLASYVQAFDEHYLCSGRDSYYFRCVRESRMQRAFYLMSSQLGSAASVNLQEAPAVIGWVRKSLETIEKFMEPVQ